MKTTSFRQVIVAMAIAVTAATVHGAWFASADATNEGAPVASIRMAEWDHYEQKWVATIVGDGETLRHSEGAIFELRSQSGGAVSVANAPAGLTIETLDAQDIEALDIPLPTASNLVAYAPLTTVPTASGAPTYIRLAVSTLEADPGFSADVLQTRPPGHVGAWSGPLTPTDTDRAALDVDGSVGVHADVELTDGNDTVTFNWDIGRWAKGDLFLGMNRFTYRVLDRNGEFKRFVASADIDEPDSEFDFNITAGCAANWKTGEVFATNFADLAPAVNVITRHPSSVGRSLYSPADRRIVTITENDVVSGAEMSVDINPESVVFDAQMNMYVGHSDSFFGPVATDVFDSLTLNHPTLYDNIDDWYFLDVAGWPLSYSDGGLPVVVDETGGVLQVAPNGVAPFGTRLYGIQTSTRLKYSGNNLIFSPTTSMPGLGLPALLPQTYLADPTTGAPLMTSSGTEIVGRWPMGRRIHRYNVQPDGSYRGFNTEHPDGPDRDLFWAATARFGTDWVDLNATGDVAYYTSEDSLIHRYRVRPGINNDPLGQLPDVGNGQLLPGENIRFNAMRILPPGDGSGGFLAAGDKAIYRFAANGAFIQKYQVNDDPYLKSQYPEGSQDWIDSGLILGWYAMEVDPGGKSFWASSNDSGWIYQFDIASGRELRRIEAVEYLDVDTDPEEPEGRVISSVCVMWEYTAPQEVCFAADGSPDGNDDDGDGLIDENCKAIEVCNNVVDDDGDGLSDNHDPDCGAELPPVAEPDYYITDQNVDLSVPSGTTVGVLINDSDPDNTASTEPWRQDTVLVAAFGATTPNLAPGTPLVTASGTVTLAADGSFVYDPAPTFHGQFTFVYTVTDGVANSAPTTVTIDVRPLVVNDVYQTALNTPLNGSTILANDSIAPMVVSAAGPNTITSLTGPSITFQTSAGGTVVLNTNGTFLYTPALDYFGIDSFVYLGYDGNTDSVSTATVTINVSDVNAVFAVNDFYTTAYITPTTQNLLFNDTDPQSDSFQLTHINGQAVSNGSVVTVALPGSLSATVLVNTVGGTVTITPPTNYFGTFTFPYVIRDNATAPATSTATVTVVVQEPGTFSVTNDEYTTLQNTPIIVPASSGVLSNDVNIGLPVFWAGGFGPNIPLNGLPLTLITPSGGTVVLSPDGSLVYTPAPGFVGVENFLYGVRRWDGTDFRANVKLTVLPVNRPPVAVNDSATTQGTTPVTIAVLPNDSDPDNDPLTVVPTGFTQPANGTVTLSGSVFTFVANAGFTGTTTFTYTISDGRGGTAVATVSVLVTAAPCGVAPAPSVALVRTQSTFDGTLRGSVQIMQAVGVTLNSTAVITGDLMMPGLPTIVNNGTPNYTSVLGTGAATPTSHQFMFNSGASLGRLVRRTDAVALPTVAAPPATTGTRSVTMNSPTDTAGDFATLRSLTLNSNVGPVTVPAGTYDTFIANSGSSFVVGVVGATTPSVYNFQSLTLNSGSSLQVVGPVVITVRNSMALNGPVGASANPKWLTLRVSNGDLTLNSNVPFHGYVEVPAGRVTINTGAILKGGLAANALTINSGGVLELVQEATTPCPGHIVIKIDDQTKVYGSTDPALTYQVISGGPVPSGVLSGAITRAAGEAIGGYPITQGSLAVTSGYTLEVIPGTFTITPRQATVTAGSASKTYGSSDPALSPVTTSGFAPLDLLTLVLGQTRAAGENVGSYVTTPTALGAILGNYSVTYLPGAFTIVPKPVTVQAHDKTRPVGQPNPTLDGVWTGLVSGDAITATYATPANLTSPAGTYAITPTPVDPNNRLGNYIVTVIPGTLTVTPSAPPCSTTGYLTYSQGGWGSSPSGNNPGAFLASKFSTVYPGGSVQIGGTKKLTFTSAAAIAAFLPQGGSSNVLGWSATNPTSSSAGNFAAQLLALRLAVDFSAAGVTKTGMGALVMQSGPLAGMTVDAILAMSNTVIGGATSALPSGMSMSTLSGILKSLNMNFHEGSVNQGLLGCPGSTPCAASTLAFTGNSSVSGTPGNIRTFSAGAVSVNASAFSRVKGSGGSWATAYLGVWSEGLGVTDTSESGSGDTHKLDNNGRLNYILFEFSQPVVVTKAFLDSIYGDSDATVWVGTKTNPFTNHLTLSDALLSSLGTAETSTGGSSDRWAEFNGNDVTGNVLVIAADTGGSNDSFKVSKLQLECAETPEQPDLVTPTVVATGGSFVYSGTARTATCSVTGDNNAVMTGTLTYSSGATAPTQVGTYTATCAFAGNTTYAAASATATVIITPAPLTVVANNKTKTQGAANPALDGTLTGVVAGDAITASYSTSATASSPVGSYSIVPSLVDIGNKLSNYTVTKTNGTLTVTAGAPPCSVSQFTFSGSSSTYGSTGNTRSFSSGSVSVKASAFSRTTGSNGSWAKAYLGVWSEGLGVTDGSEGTGGGHSHKTDNVGRLNFILLEFSQPVVVTAAYLNSVTTDSDATIWVGTANNPYVNHLTLSDAVLGNLGSAQQSSGGSSARWATFNGSDVVGNVVVIAADVTGTNDQFKLNKLTVECPPAPGGDDDDDHDGEDHDCREHGSYDRDCDHERGRNGHHDGDRCDHERDDDYRRGRGYDRDRDDDRGRDRGRRD